MTFQSIATAIRREWRLAVREPVMPATLVIIGCVTALALLTGWLRTSQRIEIQRLLEQENIQQRLFLESAFQDGSSTIPSIPTLTPIQEERRAQLQMSARSPDILRFTGGLWRSVLPASSLNVVSTGVSGEWQDHYYHAGPSQTRTLARTIWPNPLLAAVGTFDLTLVIGAIIPLAIIVLTYNVVAADREDGRWDLIRSHAPSTPILIITRCFVRTGALALAILTITAGWLVFVPTSSWEFASTKTFVIWIAWVCAYLTFWTLVAILVNAFRFSSSASGLLLLLCWFVTVIVAPSVVERLTNRNFPIMPPADLIAIEEDTQKQVEKEGDTVWAEFLSQHREIKLDQDNPQQEQLLRDIALSACSRSRMNAEIETYMQNFLDRENSLDRWQLLTPLLAWRTAADQCAGNSLRHFVEFSRRTAQFHDEHVTFFEPMSMVGWELTLTDIQHLPRFDSRQLQTRLEKYPLLLSAASLGLWTAGCAMLIWLRFRHCGPI